MEEARFTGEELLRATGGAWIGGREPSTACGVFTDSRVWGDGKLFLALAGERFDGHDHLAAAVAAGAGALCIERGKQDRLPAGELPPVLLVEDTLRAFQRIAGFHRNRFPGLCVAGVTGSVGKTSVKEMLRAIFSEAAGAEHVLYTLGNTNNQVGVPQNLLRLTPACRYAVIEMGTNHHGEIEPLSRIARPQAALVNSIAPCHLEFLGDLTGVAREKAHIFDGLESGGVAVIPQDAPAVETLLAGAGDHSVLRFGEGESAAVCCRYLGGNLRGSSFELKFAGGERFTVRWPLSGRHQALNAAAAATLAEAVGIAPAVIVSGLVKTELPGMRSRIVELDGVTYVNDAYNANPRSMRAAFDYLAEFADPARLLLVLGEMYELGDCSAAEHQALLREARERFPGCRIVAIGAAFDPVAGVTGAADSRKAFAEVEKLTRPGDLVFAKGSRGVAVELALPEAVR